MSLKFGFCTPLFTEYHPAKKSVEQESKRKQKKTKIPTFFQKNSYSVTKPDIAMKNKRHYDNNRALYSGIDWFLTS